MTDTVEQHPAPDLLREASAKVSGKVEGEYGPYTNADWQRECRWDEALKAAESRLLALQHQAERLESAVRWALGEEGEFPQRDSHVIVHPGGRIGPKDGAYWWRKELRERAGLVSPVEEQTDG